MESPESAELDQYRAQVREWVAAHAGEAPPARDRGAAREDDERVAERRAWQAVLADAGLAAVAWPREYGGQGLTPAHQVVVDSELEAAGVAGVYDVIGIGMLGPAIIAHGSPEQRARHLRPLLRADEVWCQLFSEPEAGSDLAAVRTRAGRRPDGGWAVSGQKVWTSNAGRAAFGLLLARTDFRAPKHDGLTMFIVPMASPGVTVRPLRQLSGEARFNEVFLDDVALAPGAVVGVPGNGWRVALDTLAFERLAIGRTADSLTWTPEDFALALAADPTAAGDRDVQRRFGEIASELLALRHAGRQAALARQRAAPPDPASALAKVTAVAATARAADLLADVLGPGALDDRDGWGILISDLPGLRTAGGTEEIVRTLVGELALGLEREPRADRGIPFSELLRAGERP